MAKTKAFKITQNNQYIQEINLNAGEYTFSRTKLTNKQTTYTATKENGALGLRL